MNAPLSPRSTWIFDARTDLLAFGGSAAIAFALVGLGSALGLADGDTPTWLFVLAVIGVDVGHVWSTLFRTYLDPDERARHPLRYVLFPAASFLVGVTLHAIGAWLFWRVLAYLAVFHFVRQQIGWVALYEQRNGEHGTLDRTVDRFVIYATTLHPLFVWHARLPRSFHWFVDGDFVTSLIGAPVTASWLVPAIALAAFVVRQLDRARRGLRVSYGKVLVVSVTASTWYVGIVLFDSDYVFTVTNVLVHGLPYFVLTRRHARATSALLRPGLVGLATFATICFALAFVEEGVWDRLVWHDHRALFGAGTSVTSGVLAWLVPLLAVPQATHYVLDGLVWRRGSGARFG